MEATAAEDSQQSEAISLFLSPSSTVAGWVLPLSFALFVVSFADLPVSVLVSLAGVLLFHELGHFVGMRLLGFSNVRMFFVPFMGAAVSGRDETVTAWKEGLVLLLGPLPGLLLAAPLIAVSAVVQSPWVTGLVWMLMGLNVLQLLPIEPLDGGKLVRLVLYGRHPIIEIIFGVAASVGLAAVAAAFADWFLGILAFFMFSFSIGRFRISRLARDLKEAVPGMSQPAALLGSEQLEALHERALGFAWSGKMGSSTPPKPKAVANVMRAMHDAVRFEPPGFGVSALLLAAWGGGFVLFVVELVACAMLGLVPGGG